MKSAKEWFDYIDDQTDSQEEFAPICLSKIEQIQQDARDSALREAAELVRNKFHSPECQDQWSITRTMALGEAATKILSLITKSKI